MMIDPHVHFHVLPRYDTAIEHEGTSFIDAGWPGPPRLDQHNALASSEFEALVQLLIGSWPEVGR